MKHLFTPFLCVFLLFSNSFKSQNEVLHNHKVLNEADALKEFKYSQFNKDFVEHSKSLNFDLSNDECLRNFFTISHSVLLNAVFQNYMKAGNNESYLSIFKTQQSLFKNHLQLFIQKEKELRFAYRKQKLS